MGSSVGARAYLGPAAMFSMRQANRKRRASQTKEVKPLAAGVPLLSE